MRFAILAASLWLGSAHAADVNPPSEVVGPSVPPFEEIYGLVRSNLTGVSSEKLNRAAVLGLLSELKSQVVFVTNSANADPSGALLGKVTTLEGAYGLIKVRQVKTGLSKELAGAVEQLRATNKFKGLIVDLRFATGLDYRAAADTADLFFNGDQPLLQWGDQNVRATTKTGSIDVPTVVLINGATAGAAEALAAGLRQAEGTLLIGNHTAGQAYLFREFNLSTGQAVRIATGWISAGDHQNLSEKGLSPDIPVTVALEEERTYPEDPYKSVSKPLAQGRGTNLLDSTMSPASGKPRRRPNEADLVRMQRDGTDLATELSPANGTATVVPMIADPVLARGLDLLKGLSLALKRR